MKILVTGGAGFIGSHIVDDLIKRGYRVSVIDNLIAGKKENLNQHAKFYYGDITHSLENIFENEKPNIVIHAAAQTNVRDSLKDSLYDATTNILGTINVLESCRKNNVEKIIYTSTGGARVGEPEYLPVDEKHPINPTSPYGISKHTAEHYISAYSNLYALESLILCFGNVYGPRDNVSSGRLIPVFIDKMLKKERPTIFGDGNQTRDFIYVKDLSELIVNSIEKKPEHNLFHLANGEQTNINKVFKILKKFTNFNEEPIYSNSIKGEVKDIFLDISLAKKELGWHPKTPLEEGLKETVDYFRNN